jgi:small GTP-binding protein
MSGEILKKLVIAGDSAVGKSCLVLRYVEDTFSLSHVSTIGLDFRIKMIEKDEKKIKLQVWDTAGQYVLFISNFNIHRERFRAMASTYFRVANGVIVAFDVTSEDSFDAIHVWIKQIREAAPENVKIILIGNKIDMEDARKITTEQGREMAEKLKLEEYFEASAKSGAGVQEAFSALVDYTLGIKKSKWAPDDEPSHQPQPTPVQPNEPTTTVTDVEKPIDLTQKPAPKEKQEKCAC